MNDRTNEPEYQTLNEIHSGILQSLTAETLSVAPELDFQEILDHRFDEVVKATHSSRLVVIYVNEADRHMLIDGFGDYVDRCGERVRNGVEAYRTIGLDEQSEALLSMIAEWPCESSGELIRHDYESMSDEEMNELDKWQFAFDRRTDAAYGVLTEVDPMYASLRHVLRHASHFFTSQDDHFRPEPLPY